MSATIGDLHDAIERGFAERFVSRVRTIKSYRASDGDLIETPAIIIEIDRAEEGDDRGDDRTPVRLYFNAFCLLSVETANLPLNLREFAAEVLSIVRRNRWGLGDAVGRPEELEIGEAEFDPGQNGYDSMYVSWSQVIYLGETIWDNAGVVPTTVFLGQVPDVGFGHEPDYDDITEYASNP